MKAPAFQFYPGDWLSSQRVALMTLEEEGAYIRLLSFCWQHGSIPSEPEKLAKLIGKGASTTLATTLATMFEPGENGLVHRRLDAERKKQKEWAEKSQKGGKASAEKRQKDRIRREKAAEDQAPLQGCLANGDTQTPTLLSSPFHLSVDKPSEKSQRTAQAEAIYQAYPRKAKKPPAIKAILKAMASHSPAFLLECTQAYARAITWQDRHFIPYPSTWFNDERFNDDPADWKQPGMKPAAAFTI